MRRGNGPRQQVQIAQDHLLNACRVLADVIHRDQGTEQVHALHHRGPTLIFPWGGSSKLVVTREGVGGGPGRGDELTILDRYFGP